MRLTAAMAIALACAGTALPADKWDGQFEKTLNVSGAADLDIATDSHRSHGFLFLESDP